MKFGVRARVLAIALVPSVALLLAGIGTTSFLVSDSHRTRAWAVELSGTLDATRTLIEGVQAERLATMARLAGKADAGPDLTAARAILDRAVSVLRTVKASVVDIDPKLGDNVGRIETLLQQLVSVRQAADAMKLAPADAYIFYNKIVDVVEAASLLSQRKAPDAEIGVEMADSLQLLKATEAMARSNAMAVVLEGVGGSAVPVVDFAEQTGYYRLDITSMAHSPESSQHDAASALVVSESWAKLDEIERNIGWRAGARSIAATNAENGLPVALTNVLPSLSVPDAEWQKAAADVNRQLLDMWIGQNAHFHALAVRRAGTGARRALQVGAAVGLIGLCVIGISVVLADRIIRRLRRLRSETLELADVTLPNLVQKLESNQAVDPVEPAASLKFGTDEIGQVAQAFEQAASAAVTAAVMAARTREGVKAVFLNIAHRSQVVVHRQLEILDEAERDQEDPAILDILFRLDHLATRERRNAENLVILGGGRIGRQWRNPVVLSDLVRSATGETMDYTRVRVLRLPEVSVLGGVVADLAHLIAELVDNAISFSPPDSRIEVTGRIVGRGVVVQIDDQGVGMATADVARNNAMLADPPDFGVAALSADSRLGLFVVARLAARHGISVKLTESDFGGVRAIVLVPSALLAGFAVGEQEVIPATLPKLPRRERKTTNSPEPEILSGPTTESPPTRPQLTADQARDLITAIQHGTLQGRNSGADNTFDGTR